MKNVQSSGFTLVELIVTIVVAGLFITVISNMSGFVVNAATSAHRFEMASNLAYNNLRIYANGGKGSDFGFTCNGDDTSDTEATTPFTDGVKYPYAVGMLLINSPSGPSIYNLPAPVTQTVAATAPYGCGNTTLHTTAGIVVRVVSTVTYGSPARKVVHATYVRY